MYSIFVLHFILFVLGGTKICYRVLILSAQQLQRSHKIIDCYVEVSYVKYRLQILTKKKIRAIH